ncbi:hypothetical protein ON010_g15703 [Phytophthora cinnamomi]|nr:hypothetical protein ON010_g15703 [Phytophthora cinnamomi]
MNTGDPGAVRTGSAAAKSRRCSCRSDPWRPGSETRDELPTDDELHDVQRRGLDNGADDHHKRVDKEHFSSTEALSKRLTAETSHHTAYNPGVNGQGPGALAVARKHDAGAVDYGPCAIPWYSSSLLNVSRLSCDVDQPYWNGYRSGTKNVSQKPEVSFTICDTFILSSAWLKDRRRRRPSIFIRAPMVCSSGYPQNLRIFVY